MRILHIDTTPIATIPFANAGLKRPTICRLPVLVGEVDRLPDGVEGLVLAADLQGREERGRHWIEAPLIGEILPGLLEPILAEAGLPEPLRLGAILAGDLFTVPLVKRRGGTGDVTPVWLAFARAFRWVAGVAGNHDLFGGAPSPAGPLRRNERFHFLESSVSSIGGVAFGGVFGAMGNPKRPNSFDTETYVAQLLEVLTQGPDVVVLHDGPETPRGDLGRPEIRELLEACPPGQPGLVVRGHAYWPEPIGVLAGGTQVLNVDGRVVVLVTRHRPRI